MSTTKMMKVELIFTKAQTASEGYMFQTQSWEIPCSALADGVAATEIEQHMQLVIGEAFPVPMRDSIKYLMYDALSAGGELVHGDHKLKVGFENKHHVSNPAPKPLEA